MMTSYYIETLSHYIYEVFAFSVVELLAPSVIRHTKYEKLDDFLLNKISTIYISMDKYAENYLVWTTVGIRFPMKDLREIWAEE